LLNHLAGWLDSRTGYKAILRSLLDAPIPGGPRWRYVLGSALASTFLIELVTGLLLMTSYSPSSTTAWGSVYYINEQMALGWFIRGLHRFGTYAMVILLGLHVLQVVLAGAYRAPRELNWWLGLALMVLTLILGVTGNLLPWDQRGYWAATVETTIAGSTPVLGPTIQTLIVGGPDYGNLTLTRLYGLHVGVLPALFILGLVTHLALFRRYGPTPPEGADARGAGRFWPQQVFYNTAAGAAVLAVLIALTVKVGANLEAPADPTGTYPARPEWYFLPLFQLRKSFEGTREVIATIVIPGAIMTVLAALPFLDRVFPRRPAHFAACGFVFALAGGVGYLTFDAVREDWVSPEYRQARREADAASERALQLARDGRIGPDGAGYLLSRDPLTRGKATLADKCLNCHYFEGKGQIAAGGKGKSAAMSAQVAPELAGFGSYAWIRGLLDEPQSPRYFGKVPEGDGMQTWKQQSTLEPKQLDEVARFVAAFAEVDGDTSPDDWAARKEVREHPGRKWFFKRGECANCHSLNGVGSLAANGSDAKKGYTLPAPDLFGWGSPRWVARMIKNPGSRHLYGYLGEEQKMPGFGAQLSADDLESLVKFLKGDFLPPGSPPARPVAPSLAGP